jgi:hypothetical protein
MKYRVAMSRCGLCCGVPPSQIRSPRGTLRAMAATRGAVLQVYRDLLRGARRFKSYNFREYIKRRVREEFKKAKHETDPEKIHKLLQYAIEQNGIVQRQAIINTLYTQDELILEIKERERKLKSLQQQQQQQQQQHSHIHS